jgi:sugar phosphate isomerase/epimerase
MSDLHTFPFCAQNAPYKIDPIRTDWIEFMKALKQEGYDGALNFEIAAPGPLPVKMAGYRYLSKIGRYLSSVFEETNI